MLKAVSMVVAVIVTVMAAAMVEPAMAAVASSGDLEEVLSCVGLVHLSSALPIAATRVS